MGKTPSALFSDAFAEIETPWAGSEAKELWLKNNTPTNKTKIIIIFFILPPFLLAKKLPNPLLVSHY
jgi:hypothetical protein